MKLQIWKYFGFQPDDKGNPRWKDQPKCRLCKTEIAAKDGNATNLYSHLKNKHLEEYRAVRSITGSIGAKRQQDLVLQASL